MAADCRRMWATTRRCSCKPPTAHKRRLVNSWSTITAARGLSTAVRCACRLWWCGRVGRTAPLRPFASSIIREPPGGTPYARSLPIRSWRWRRHAGSSPASIHALDLPSEAFADSRPLQLPGFSVSVGDMVEAVRRLGIRWQPDPWCNRSAPAGRPPIPPRAPWPSVSPPMPTSTRWSGPSLSTDLEMQKLLV